MNTPTHKSLLLGALLLLTASCSASKNTSVSIGPFQPQVLSEIEVNDFAWSANNVGWVSPGDTIQIQGSISDQGYDPRDGFKFFATKPLVVNVSLSGLAPGSDLDWCVWDPALGIFTACAETEFNPETGSFLVLSPGKEFQLVVSSYFGTTNYSMTVSFSTFFGATADGAAPDPESFVPRNDPKLLFGRDDRWQTPDIESELLKSLYPSGLQVDAVGQLVPLSRPKESGGEAQPANER